MSYKTDFAGREHVPEQTTASVSPQADPHYTQQGRAAAYPDDQPSPSKLAVEATNNIGGYLTQNVVSRLPLKDWQAILRETDRAISSALAERDAVLKGVEDRLEDILHSLTDCGQRCLPSTRILATDLLTKLRSLKR